MPLLNSKKNLENKTNDISNKLEPLKEEISKLNLAILNLKEEIKILKSKQNDLKLDRVQLASFISYTDKKRVNNCIKDLTNIKKQINLSKTSKIFKEITSIKERLDNIEESFVSDFEDGN